MKTFVLAALIASAAFGLASAEYECSKSMDDMIKGLGICATQGEKQCAKVEKITECIGGVIYASEDEITEGTAFEGCDDAGTDACIECVMEEMGFGTDVGAFEKAEKQITDDTAGSMNCLAAVGMAAGQLDLLLRPLKTDDEGKKLDLDAVLGDNDLKANLYELFGLAKLCIIGDGEDIKGATPTSEYKCGKE